MDIIIDDSRDNIVQKQIKGIVNAIHVVTTKYQKNITLLESDRSDKYQKKSVMRTTLLKFQNYYYIHWILLHMTLGTIS